VGFVETAFVRRRSELWVTQMTSGLVHVFSTADNSWLDSIPTGGYYPKLITLADDEKTAYVSNWVSNDVSVIDVDERTVTARIPVGGTPRGMALSADRASLYVCLFDSGTVRKIDLATRTIARSLSFGSGAMRHIIRDPRRNLLYASDMLRGRVLVIDPEKDVLVTQVIVDANLNTIALSPDGRYLFVSPRGPNNQKDYTKPGPALGKVYSIALP
jgi:YVTN family beta-propeller protein